MFAKLYTQSLLILVICWSLGPLGSFYHIYNDPWPVVTHSLCCPPPWLKLTMLALFGIKHSPITRFSFFYCKLSPVQPCRHQLQPENSWLHLHQLPFLTESIASCLTSLISKAIHIYCTKKLKRKVSSLLTSLNCMKKKHLKRMMSK